MLRVLHDLKEGRNAIMFTTKTESAPFLGDFDLLPLRAHLDIGGVPLSPSMRDFDDAMTHAIRADPFTVAGAAAIWHGEAVRWRRGHANAIAPLDLGAIAQATAEQIYRKQIAELAEGQS